MPVASLTLPVCRHARTLLFEVFGDCDHEACRSGKLFSVPVVPQKTVAEVSIVGNLQERSVVLSHGWQSKKTLMDPQVFQVYLLIFLTD